MRYARAFSNTRSRLPHQYVAEQVFGEPGSPTKGAPVRELLLDEVLQLIAVIAQAGEARGQGDAASQVLGHAIDRAPRETVRGTPRASPRVAGYREPAISQTRTVLSSLAEASVLPSGENPTARMEA
jgi:hypothetical protein